MNGAPLYAVYLLIIFGHGFRYGRPYLYNSLGLSIVGFAFIFRNTVFLIVAAGIAGFSVLVMAVLAVHARAQYR